ncbi:DUF7344 domain-containing protein [Halomarina litorea]|uniref:DUF7344 domain-containing protein n=1 Tax=Halomarina litorea TaxID=2961595 RepID=UPI0020C228AD|nr:hypothetical protein [Halomarina sp. BCD28]
MSVDVGVSEETTTREGARETTTEATSEQGTARLSKDTVFEALTNSRRRATLHYLEANDGEANIGDLAEHIAADENGISELELNSAQRKRVYIGLYQCHLPKLDEMGIVDFDKHRGTVVLVPETAAQVYPYLHLDPLSESSEEDGGLLRGLRNRLRG